MRTQMDIVSYTLYLLRNEIVDGLHSKAMKS